MPGCSGAANAKIRAEGGAEDEDLAGEVEALGERGAEGMFLGRDAGLELRHCAVVVGAHLR